MKKSLLIFFASLSFAGCDAWYCVQCRVTDNSSASSEIVRVQTFRADTARVVQNALVSGYALWPDSSWQQSGIVESRYTGPTGEASYIAGFNTRRFFGAIIVSKEGFKTDTVTFNCGHRDTVSVIVRLKRQ